LNNLSVKTTKQILIPNKNPNRFFAIDFFASLYQGSSPSFQFLASLSDPFQIYDNQQISPKPDALVVFENEIKEKVKGSIIGFYLNPDSYNQMEDKKHLMRKALQVVQDYQMGVYIETTSDLILNDFDLLRKIKEFAPVVITIPIGHTTDLVSEKIEGVNAVKFIDRIKLLRKCKDAGFITGILFKPLIPYINDSEDIILHIIDKAKDAFCDFIYPSFVISLEENQRKSFFELIDHDFPGLKNVYMDKFGMKKTWASPYQQNLKKQFVFACKKNKIAYGMKDIIQMIKPSKNEQFTLF
jgi:DNA repair photolyase